MAREITYNNFEISVVVFYAKYHNKSCYNLYKRLYTKSYPVTVVKKPTTPSVY